MFNPLHKKALNILILGTGEEAWAFVRILQEVSKRLKIKLVGIVVIEKQNNLLLQYAQRRNIPIFSKKNLPKDEEIDLVIDTIGTEEATHILKKINRPTLNYVGAYLLYHIVEDLKDKIHLERKFSYNERMEMISALANSLADAIRNPVMAIGGFAKSILEAKEKDYNAIIKKATVILEEAKKLEKVLREISNLAKPYVLRKEVKDINEVLEELCMEFIPIFEEHKIKLVKKLEPEEIFTLFDVDLFKKALEVIFKVSIEVMKKGGILTITTELCWDFVLITIAYTAKEIEYWELESSLHTFFSWENTSYNYLNTAKKIIEDHGGKFIIYTQPEGGSKILIEMPIELPRKPPI
jgi:signal transduction histidine kinase